MELSQPTAVLHMSDDLGDSVVRVPANADAEAIVAAFAQHNVHSLTDNSQRAIAIALVGSQGLSPCYDSVLVDVQRTTEYGQEITQMRILVSLETPNKTIAPSFPATENGAGGWGYGK